MHPVVRAAPACALIAALGAASAPTAMRPALPTTAPIPLQVSARARDPMGTLQPCRGRSLPIGPRGRCIPLPAADEPEGEARTRRLGRLPQAGLHVPIGPGQAVPRLPDRPLAFSAYQLPIDPLLGVHEAPAPPRGTASLALILESDGGAPVTLVELEGQRERATVALVGALHGVTVATRHVVDHPAGPRAYVALYGRLARPGPRIVNGAPLSPMEVVGFIEAPGVDTHARLHFEIRQLDGVDGATPPHLSELVRRSVPVDARNVLPKR